MAVNKKKAIFFKINISIYKETVLLHKNFDYIFRMQGAITTDIWTYSTVIIEQYLQKDQGCL